jgi:glycosyltransferase involved in cell wall biosynthesis
MEPQTTARVGRVALNLLYLVPREVGGTEVYARRLVHSLAAAYPDVDWVVFAGTEAAPSLAEEGWPDCVRIKPVPLRARIKPARVGFEMSVVPVLAARERADVLHSFGTTSPLVGRVPRVVTIHDLIFRHYRGDFPLASRLALDALVPLGGRRADRVIVYSEATKRDVVSECRVDPTSIDVVPLGPGMRDFDVTPEGELRERLGLGDGPVILTVAPPLPHKNLDRLLDAHRMLGSMDPAPVLALVGHAGREGDALRARIVALGLEDRVRVTGWISNEDLEGLYRVAACCAYPSLYEGFGLPVLEAMRRGTPVACSNATSLPEVVGDAAELFDPLDVAAIAASVRRVLEDRALAADLVERGTRRAAEFTWERTAEGTMDSYRRAVEGS